MVNRLAGARSAYLQQHAENPVDWYQWGPEAFADARKRDVPILVSIGYSACHWCHVMAHESFEDPDVARIMNEHFVNIKVDREERPDVDAVYMEAAQMMTGQGGWPLNVFLTTDLHPFFAGTYFPPAPRHGLPNWVQVLNALSTAWREHRDQIEETGHTLLDRMASGNQLVPSASVPSVSVLDQAVQTLERGFDQQNGGFGGAPKFPQPLTLELLLRLGVTRRDTRLLDMVSHTLDRMAEGGIHDHLGGGFHRYSVDESWTVPHFEKMLYDNALLSRLYTEAWQATQQVRYKLVGQGIIDYVLRELASPEGGFYSSQDADSEGEEGKFFVWRPAEIDSLVGPDSALFRRRYGVTENGNFDNGTTILTESIDIETLAAETGQAPGDVEARLDRAKARLLTARNRRIHPATDTKILTDWNALMLRSLAYAGRAFGRQDYLDAAVLNAELLWDRLRPNGVLQHVYKDGSAGIPAFLDDHAYLLEGLVSLYEATGDTRWLDRSTELARDLERRFRDDEGGFRATAGDTEEALPVRSKPLFDSVCPSGNSSAAMGLLRLSRLTDNLRWTHMAVEAIRLLVDALGAHAQSFAYMLQALDFHLAPPREVAITGDEALPGTTSLVEAMYSRYLPNTVLAIRWQGQPIAEIPLLAGREMLDGHPAAYVCERYVCRLPVTDPAALLAQLSQ